MHNSTPQTGEFSFRPDVTQVGEYTLTFTVTDGDQSGDGQVKITVPENDPTNTTGFRGRILDANAAKTGEQVPVVGAEISLLKGALTVVTDSQGYFQFDDVTQVDEILDINPEKASLAPDNSKYAGFREQYTLQPKVLNIEKRPFYLPRLNMQSLTMVIPDQTTLVVNDKLGISLTVPPHTAKNFDGSDFSGSLSISEVPSFWRQLPYRNSWSQAC